MKVLAIVLLAAFPLVYSAPVVTPSEAATVSELITANGQAERINMLNDSDFVFDFFHPRPGAVSSSGPDGHIIAAKLDNFPVLVGEGIAMSVGYLGPCVSIPRIFIPVQPSSILSSMVPHERACFKKME